MNEFFAWLTGTPVGIAALLGALFLLFLLFAALYELRTRKRFPNRGGRSKQK
ncbi:MAG: hypothetical protein FWF71_01890 [Actinomycetia bacterium]|nr:hypothetical protein [Actinomycetes bacterium]